MDSNDGGAAVAAASAPVNAVAPAPPPPSQAVNKTPEAAQANHNAAPSTTTQQATAAVPPTSEASAAVVKEAQKTQSVSATPQVSNNTPSPSIPSSATVETKVSASAEKSDSNQSQSQPKPNEDKDKNSQSTTIPTSSATTQKTNNDTVNTNSTSSSSSSSSESKLDGASGGEQNRSEPVQNQGDKKTEQQKTVEPVAESKADSDKQEPTVSESPFQAVSNDSNKDDANQTNSGTTSNADTPAVSGSEKLEKTQDSNTTTTSSSSSSSEASSLKTTATTTTLPTAATVPSKPVATIKPMESTTATTNSAPVPMDTSTSKSNNNPSKSNNKRPAEDGGEESSDKKLKSSAAAASSSSSSSSGGAGQKEGGGKSAEQVLEYMEKTFDQRRKIITKQMPTIPELKSMYPELFMGKQLLLEFQRITKIDIDQKIQEFCVRYATAVIEMARSNKAAAPVLARWEQAKQENETLKQYWDMVTALCLLPLHFGENFVEMVLEIGEDDEVKAQGKIVPTLVARGNIFRTDEFFLIAENTIVQEFEEFTIAFASLYSSYWVFNMVYPETIENTYNYIQRCIVRQREPGAISAVCKNFTKSLQKWNKEKEAKNKKALVSMN